MDKIYIKEIQNTSKWVTLKILLMPTRFTHRFKDLPQNTDGCFLSVMLISAWKNIYKSLFVFGVFASEWGAARKYARILTV